ncbi:MAG: hypothetical protein WCK58_12135 [Chloroflexota bacterium]
MSLQLHRPDGKGGLEVKNAPDENWRGELKSSRWGAALKGGQLPELKNPEMDPASSASSVALWGGLALLTFVLIVAGYAVQLWHFAP